MPEIIVSPGYAPQVGSDAYRNEGDNALVSPKQYDWLLQIRPEWIPDMVEIIQDGLRCVPDAPADLKEYLAQQCEAMGRVRP